MKIDIGSRVVSRKKIIPLCYGHDKNKPVSNGVGEWEIKFSDKGKFERGVVTSISELFPNISVEFQFNTKFGTIVIEKDFFEDWLEIDKEWYRDHYIDSILENNI